MREIYHSFIHHSIIAAAAAAAVAVSSAAAKIRLNYIDNSAISRFAAKMRGIDAEISCSMMRAIHVAVLLLCWLNGCLCHLGKPTQTCE